jgi:hypothetical protein
MSLTKLSLAGKSLIIPGQGEFGDIPAGDMKTASLFYSASSSRDREERKSKRGKGSGALLT